MQRTLTSLQEEQNTNFTQQSQKDIRKSAEIISQAGFYSDLSFKNPSESAGDNLVADLTLLEKGKPGRRKLN